MFGKKTDTLKMSLPQTRTVRGYEIKRLPLGEQLQAVDELQELPGELLKACFPGMNAGQILAELKGFNADMLVQMLGSAITAGPKQIIKAFSRMAGIPEEKLLQDPNIGLDGIMELIQAWLEVAGIENFIRAGQAVTAKVKAAAGSFLRQKTGSKG